MDKTRLLIVDDEQDMLSGIKRMLQREFTEFEIYTASNGEQALALMDTVTIDIALFDVKMSGMSGIELLQQVLVKDPLITIVMMTGYATIELAVQSMSHGAYNFISKPFDKEILYQTIRKAVERNVLLKENFLLKKQVNDIEGRTQFVGQSIVMKRFLSQLQTIARTNYTTLVRGESGTGKELTARAIHALSPRNKKPFIVVNCPAIPEHLLESELFGHVKGAFTGANGDHPGLFAEADGGTICLDEIGDMPVNIQAKLLRVLQEHEIKPLGAVKTRKVDVRVIALTNLDLETMIAEKQFREDLFYRLNVVTLNTPNLTELIDDIPLLAQHFAAEVSDELKIEPKRFSMQACQHLTRRQWPGNVRELQNSVRRIVMFSEHNIIEPEEIYAIENIAHQPKTEATCPIFDSNSAILPYKEAKEQAVETFTKTYIEALLKQTDGNISRAAELSGISRVALQKIVKRHSIDPQTYR